MAPMFDTREPSIAALECAPIYFRFGSAKRRVLVDRLTADAILTVYRGVAPELQEKLAAAVNSGNPGRFSKAVALCWKYVRVG